jgi:tRNA A-37 threonylcarbamoyl transferase component Bud32
MQRNVANPDLSLGKTEPQAADSGEVVSAATRFDPLVGNTLADRYEVIRRIGEGGMGAVYEARHSIIGKRVAIKVLLEKFLENQELVARLLQEARLASSIGHQNIVDVTDFGTTRDGRAFVVMEYLEGEPLSELIMRDAPLPVERSLAIVKQIASALGAAHSKGIVHRDVKPENAYLVRRGDLDFVKVVDFGVSKAARSQEEAGSDWQRLTRTGAVLGTPLFMSPEQAAGGEDIDERADIWSTALILYECMTGELPFHGNNYLGVIAQIQNKDVVPPSALRPELGIPASIDRLVMHGLERDRTRRYQRMAEFERDIDHLLAGDPDVALEGYAETESARVAQVRSRWAWYFAVATVFAIGITAAGMLAHDEKVNPEPAAPRAVAASPMPVIPPSPATAPARVSEPALAAPSNALVDQVRAIRPSGRGRTARAAVTAGPTNPTPRKSKADDKVAPSPYPSTPGH